MSLREWRYHVQRQTRRVRAGGVASIAHAHETANANCLTSVEDVDPLGGMVLYTGVPIELELLS